MVAGRPIPQAAFDEWTDRIRPTAEQVGASYFEATTAIAFADFAARGVDVAVIEVGLGGRLDSTNVLQPVVSVVTHIGRDHTEYLGETLPEIAREKAGIAKAGTPFVVGEATPEIVDILSAEAVARGALVLRVEPGARYDGALGLAGPHQARNAAVARVALDVLPAALRPSPDATARGFAAARLAGRFDRRGRWIFDVAHNESGVEVLVEALAAAHPPRPLHALVGILADKPWASMLRRLASVADAVWVTDPPSAPADRKWNVQAAGAAARAMVEPDFDRALCSAQQGAGTVLVTGSFHTVGDAMARLPGFAPLG